jgi:hypothetical protein
MFFFTYLKEILLGIVGFFALYLFNRNKTLKLEKEQLITNNNEKDTIINIQAKDINASGKIKPSDTINDAIDRLSDKN